MGAPLPPVPGVLEMRLQGTIPGEVWENVLHFAYSGPAPSNATLTTFATAAGNAWNLHMSAMAPIQIQLAQVTVTDIASDLGAEGVSSVNAFGTRAGTDVGANSALLISYGSPTRYRGGHFRSYLLVGCGQDLTNPMSWLASFASAVHDNWQSFLNGVIGQIAGGNQITQLVGVRRHGKYLPNGGPPHYVLNTPIAYPLNVSTIVAHTQVASQKGRIGRRSK